MKMAKCCNSSSSRIVQYLPYLFLQRISAYELVKSDEGKKKSHGMALGIDDDML